MVSLKVERILCVFGTVVLIVVIGVFLYHGKLFEMQTLGKIVKTLISYILWIYMISARSIKIHIFLHNLKKQNENSLKDALLSKPIKKAVFNGYYECLTKNRKRGIAILESTLPICETYSDRALILYLLSLVYCLENEGDEARKCLDLAIGLRPYFTSALELQQQIMV